MNNLIVDEKLLDEILNEVEDIGLCADDADVDEDMSAEYSYTLGYNHALCVMQDVFNRKFKEELSK